MKAPLFYESKQDEEPAQNIQPTQQKLPELLTIREVAQYLRVDRTTVRRWIKDDTLKAILLPRGNAWAYRIRRTTIVTLLSTPAHERVAQK